MMCFLSETETEPVRAWWIFALEPIFLFFLTLTRTHYVSLIDIFITAFDISILFTVFLRSQIETVEGSIGLLGKRYDIDETSRGSC